MIISAIHETRAPFIPTKWIKTEEANTNLDSDHDTHQVLKQVWFPGAHSDVGGGNGNLDLADISLVWMIVCQIHLISFFTASWFYITIFENMKAGVCISGWTSLLNLEDRNNRGCLPHCWVSALGQFNALQHTFNQSRVSEVGSRSSIWLGSSEPKRVSSGRVEHTYPRMHPISRFEVHSSWINFWNVRVYSPRQGVLSIYPQTIRNLPTRWESSTCESVHASTWHQPHRTREIARLKINIISCEAVTQPLLPFELEVKEEWSALKKQAKLRHKDRSSESYGRMMWRAVTRKLVKLLHGSLGATKRDWIGLPSTINNEIDAQQFLASGPWMVWVQNSFLDFFDFFFWLIGCVLYGPESTLDTPNCIERL